MNIRSSTKATSKGSVRTTEPILSSPQSLPCVVTFFSFAILKAMTKIDTYLQALPQEQRVELEKIRALAHATIPELTEIINYGIPTLQYKNKNLIHFAGFEHHMSVFPGAHAIEVLASELADYQTSRGTVQFTLEKPLPDQLIRKMLAIRKTDIDLSLKK